MISVPDGTGDIADAMISASQMIYASHMKERILYHICKANISCGVRRISYRLSDISLKNATTYGILTAKEGVNVHHEDWLVPFLAIDLCDGTLVPIVNDDEDMLEIRWTDGMWIDVGFMKDEKTYYITTVADDTLESWNNPLSVLKTQNRTELIDILQQEIFHCRL